MMTPPKWMSVVVFKWMEEKALDPDFLERSRRFKENRKVGSEDGDIPPRHYVGSMSFQDLAERMAKENNGVLPSAPEVYLRAHTKSATNGAKVFSGKNTKSATNGAKVFSGKKAEETMSEFEKKKQLYESQGMEKNPNEVFYEAVGGRKKGRVPGLGNCAELFYKKTALASTSTTSYEPSIVSILEEKLTQQKQECERVTKELDAKKSKTIYLEEQFQRQQPQMSLMNQQFEAFSQLIHQHCDSSDTRPQSHNPDDPSSGDVGSSLAA